jgi:hypothetical protein
MVANATAALEIVLRVSAERPVGSMIVADRAGVQGDVFSREGRQQPLVAMGGERSLANLRYGRLPHSR